MPKISARTVAEHREKVHRRLVDAAEEILRAGRGETLTAGLVAQRAGIARNSIYRYVESVEDLHGLVLARHLPDWLSAVHKELADVDDPQERIVVWMRANLEQASTSGHGWLMGLGSSNPSAVTKDVMDAAHSLMRGTLAEAVSALIADPARGSVVQGMLRGLLEAGFKQLDAGVSAEVVIPAATQATRSLVVTLRD